MNNPKLRNIRYLYYYLKYDLLENYDSNDKIDIDTLNIKIKNIANEIFEDLVFIYEKIGYDKNTLKFIDNNSPDLAKLFYNEKIEELQKEVVKSMGAEMVDHSLNIYIKCYKNCKNKIKPSQSGSTISLKIFTGVLYETLATIHKTDTFRKSV